MLKSIERLIPHGIVRLKQRVERLAQGQYVPVAEGEGYSGASGQDMVVYWRSPYQRLPNGEVKHIYNIMREEGRGNEIYESAIPTSLLKWREEQARKRQRAKKRCSRQARPGRVGNVYGTDMSW